MEQLSLHASQEATVRPGNGMSDWLKIGEGVPQGCMLSPFYLTYMQST